MEIDFRTWNQDQLDRWCSQGNWRNQLSDLISLETDSIQQKALLNVIIRGRGDLPLQGSGFWNRSPYALATYKTLIQNLADRSWVVNMDITVEVIDWLFSFISDSSTSFIHRMTALTTISTLIKTRSLSHVVVERIVQQFPGIFTQLEMSIPTYLTQETNPLLLLTSQLQEIVELTLLKHESIITPVLVQSLSVLLSLVSLCFIQNEKTSTPVTEEASTANSNNQQEKFRIQILTIFVMAAESRKDVEGSLRLNEGKDQLIQLLQAFTQHIIHSTTIHNVYHSSFHHILHFLLSLHNVSSSALLPTLTSDLFEPILSILNHADEEGQRLDLQDLLDLQIIEVLIGFISTFFDEKSYHLLKGSNPIESEPMIQSMITGTVNMMMSLQLKLKTITKELTQKKTISSNVKDLKAAYSEIRKGCISCLESIFQQNSLWIQRNTNSFWKLSIQSLMTPILFPYAVASCLPGPSDPLNPVKETVKESGEDGCSAELKEKVYSYLYQAIEKIHLYSYAAIEDIFECIHQLTEKQCIDFVSYSPAQQQSSTVIEVLRRCLTRYPTKQEKSRSREYKWWILILSTIQNFVMMMQKNEAFYGNAQLSEWLWQYFHDCSSRLLELPALLKNENDNQSKSRVKMTYKLSTLTKATNHSNQRNDVSEEVEEDASFEYQHILLSSLATLSDILTLIQRRSALTVSSSASSQIISLILWEDIFLYLKKKMKKLQYYEYEDEMTEKYLLVDVYVKMILLYADIQQFSLTHDWLIKQILFLSYYGQINPASTTASASKLLSKKKTLLKRHYEELVLIVEQEGLKSKEKLEALREKLRDHLSRTEGEVGRDGVEVLREEMTFVITWLESMINHFNKASTPPSSPSNDVVVSDAIMKVTRDELALHMIQQLLSL